MAAKRCLKLNVLLPHRVLCCFSLLLCVVIPACSSIARGWFLLLLKKVPSIRAGEFTKKILYHGKNRVFGPKNAPKKRGSPTPNFPPPQFGKQGCAQFIKLGTLRWSHRTQRIWIYVKVTYNFLIFSLFTPSLLNKFLTLLVNFQKSLLIESKIY